MSMDDYYFSGPLGVILYLAVLTMIFIVPISVGMISSWLIMRFKKMRKTAIIVWTVILISPLIYLISHDFYMRAISGAWETYNAISWRESLNSAASTLGFVLFVWILGLVYLAWTSQDPQLNEVKERKLDKSKI